MQAGSLAVHHVVGNHCLAVGRPALLRRLAIEGDVAYRAVHIAPGWRLIILDTTVTHMAEFAEMLVRTEQSRNMAACNDSPLQASSADAFRR